MSNVCRNQILVVGPTPGLARFKREACNFKSYDDPHVDLRMDKLIPLTVLSARERECFGCYGDVGGARLRFRDSKSGFGCLDFKFDSSDRAPIEFLQKTSELFPDLEFHLIHTVGESCRAGKVTYLAGKPINEVSVGYIDPDDCLKEYLDRPGLVPWMEGLFENPVSPTLKHKNGGPE